MNNTSFKSVRATKVQAGKSYIAMIWHTHTRRSKVEVTIKGVEGNRINKGMTIVTDKFEAKSDDGIMKVNDNGKLVRVTFGIATEEVKKEYPLVKIDVATVEDVKQEEKAPAKKTRKPLTAEQKARKNALARARRAVKKEAAKA